VDGDRPSLLLVEDDAANRLTLGALLQDEGYEVCEAASFEEAETCIRRLTLHAAVLDRKLGTRDGTELARTIKQLHPECRVVVLSGEVAEGEFSSFVDDWVQKGSAFTELLVRLRTRAT
jgi:DNA-binding response OmpR family regulator